MLHVRRRKANKSKKQLLINVHGVGETGQNLETEFTITALRLESNTSQLAPHVPTSRGRNVHKSSDKTKTGATGSREWEAAALQRQVPTSPTNNSKLLKLDCSANYTTSNILLIMSCGLRSRQSDYMPTSLTSVFVSPANEKFIMILSIKTIVIYKHK